MDGRKEQYCILEDSLLQSLKPLLMQRLVQWKPVSLSVCREWMRRQDDAEERHFVYLHIMNWQNDGRLDSNIVQNSSRTLGGLLSGFEVLPQMPVLGVGKPHDNLQEWAPIRYVAEDISAVTDAYLNLVWARFYKEPLTVLETERLTVREMTVADLPLLYELYAYPHMTDYVSPLYEYEKELKFTQDYIEHMYGFYGYGLWLVFRKSDRKLVGRVGLENRELDGSNEVELGYMIGTPFQRQGYGLECCSAVIAYAFEEDGLNLPRLFACIQEENKPSLRLAERLGFTFYAVGRGSRDHCEMQIYCKSNANRINATALST